MTQGEKIDKIYDNLNIVVTHQAVMEQKMGEMNVHLGKIAENDQKQDDKIVILEKTTVTKSWMRKLGVFVLGLPTVLWVILQIINHFQT